MDYVVEPNGAIKSGNAQYTMDPLGNISYSAQVVAGFLFFTKTLKWQGTYKIDATLLYSTSLVVGKVIVVGPLRASVMAVGNGQATCGVSIDNSDFTGIATLLLSADDTTPATLDTLSASGTHDGVRLKIKVDVVQGDIHKFLVLSAAQKKTAIDKFITLLARLRYGSKF